MRLDGNAAYASMFGFANQFRDRWTRASDRSALYSTKESYLQPARCWRLVTDVTLKAAGVNIIIIVITNSNCT